MKKILTTLIIPVLITTYSCTSNKTETDVYKNGQNIIVTTYSGDTATFYINNNAGLDSTLVDEKQIVINRTGHHLRSYMANGNVDIQKQIFLRENNSNNNMFTQADKEYSKYARATSNYTKK